MNELLDFYKHLIESLGLTTNAKGGVYYAGIDDDEPYFVKGKHLTLPTPEVLKEANWGAKMAFHPLSENITRKDSPVIKAIQSLVNISMDADIGFAMHTLVRYAADKDLHSKLNSKQTKFLALFPDADETSLKNWEKVESKIGKENHLIKFNTYRDRKLNDQSYPRVTVVSLPAYEELCKVTAEKNKEYHLFGVKIRKKDAHGFKALFEYMLPGITNVAENYSFGTRSLVAPTFHAVINALYRVKSDVVKVYRLLKIEADEMLWKDHIEDLVKFKGLIPDLDGNIGELVESARRNEELNLQLNTPPSVANVAPVTSGIKTLSTAAKQPVKPTVVPVTQPLTQPLAQPVVQPVVQQPVVQTMTAPVETNKEIKVLAPTNQQSLAESQQKQFQHQQEQMQQQMLMQQQMYQQQMQAQMQQQMLQQQMYQQQMMQAQMPQMQMPQALVNGFVGVTDPNGRAISSPQMSIPQMQQGYGMYQQPMGMGMNNRQMFYGR